MASIQQLICRHRMSEKIGQPVIRKGPIVQVAWNSNSHSAVFSMATSDMQLSNINWAQNVWTLPHSKFDTSCCSKIAGTSATGIEQSGPRWIVIRRPLRERFYIIVNTNIILMRITLLKHRIVTNEITIISNTAKGPRRKTESATFLDSDG